METVGSLSGRLSCQRTILKIGRTYRKMSKGEIECRKTLTIRREKVYYYIVRIRIKK